MPKMDWSALSRMELGAYGEYFAKMELTSYGLDVYTSEVDDKGIDFVCLKDKRLLKIQVKSVQISTGYAFMKKKYFDISDDDLYLCLLLFEQGNLPEPYLIPASAWRKETPLFRYRAYDEGQKSEPEYGLNLSQKNMDLLSEFRLEQILNSILNK